MKPGLLTTLSLLLCPLAVLTCAASTVVSQQPTGSVDLKPNRLIRISDSPTRELVPVYVRDVLRSEVLSVTLQVRIDGNDVTNNVVSAQDTAIDTLEATIPYGLRLDLFTVDLSTVSLRPGQLVEYRVSVAGTGAPRIDTETAGVALEPKPSAAGSRYRCVQAFLKALGVSQPAGGGITTFPPGLTCNQVRNAVQTLRHGLATLTPSVTALDNESFACMDANGNRLVVNIDLKANGASASQSSSTGDVVIAIGGDAAPAGTGSGGAATATASKSGAASLAVGGGGNGASPGDGGDGTASSSNTRGGDSYGLGGRGGNGRNSGGNGGSGAGTVKNAGATGLGQGGDGGDPTDNTKKGGKGGNGTGSRGTSATTVTGIGAGQSGGNSFSAGQHGQGGDGRSHTSGHVGNSGVGRANS